MNAKPAETIPLPVETVEDTGAKRRQILEGARTVFLAQGFDGASMGEVAKAAGVSKGTLYVYFENKEALFSELIRDERKEQAERLFVFDTSDHDVPKALRALGRSLLSMMIRPAHMSLVRTVIGAAEKFPELGRTFYEVGPRFGIERLAAYLAEQARAGVLSIEDPERAALQFLDFCQSGITKPLLFGARSAPGAEEIARTAEEAVTIFMARYGRRD
jgi:AcrR family transcriptional regulator